MTDDGLRKAIFTELLSWTEEEGVSKIVGGDANRLVYNCFHSFPYIFSDSSPRTTECYTPDYKLDHHPHRDNYETFLQADYSA